MHTFQSLVPVMSMPRHEFPLSFFFPDAGAFMSVLRHDFPSFFQMLVPFMSMLRLDFPPFFPDAD